MIEMHPITDRASWLAMRKHDLTASDIGAAIGADPHRSALSVYADKAGLILSNGENAAMKRGRLFEGAAIEYLKEELPGWRIVRPNVYLRDPALRLGATPDALTEDETTGALVNLQIKVISRPVFEQWDGVPPLCYRLQTLAENMLLEAGLGLLVVLVVSNYDAELVLFDVPRHEAAEARIRAIALKFWDDMAAGRRPAADYGRDAETIAAMYPPRPEVPAPLDLSADNRIRVVLEEREALKAAIKEASERCGALDAEIIEKLSGAEKAIADGWKISNRLQHRAAYQVPEKDFTALRISKTKEEAA